MAIQLLVLIDKCGESGSVCAKLHFAVHWASDQNKYISAVVVTTDTVSMGAESKWQQQKQQYDFLFLLRNVATVVDGAPKLTLSF